MMEKICMGRGKDIRLTFLTHDCVKTRKYEMVHLVRELHLAYLEYLYLEIYSWLHVQRDAVFKARISQIVHLS